MVACGSSRSASRLATFFHGSASPIQIRSRARIARHFAQLRIVRQVRPPLLRYGDEHCLPRPIKRRFDAHAARRGADAGMQIGNDIDAGVQANNADAPRQPLAEE
jgi:hypothetical protein